MSSFEILDYIGVALFGVTSVNKASKSFLTGAPWGFSRLLSCATRLDIKYVNTKENKAE